MSEETNKCLNDAKQTMNKAIEYFEKELQKVRAGKANPAMLDGLKIMYYGNETPLSQVANISTPDAKTITIQPWEKNTIEPIEKAILAANLGFNPQNDGTIIRIPVPPLTEERRKDLVKKVKELAEEAKIAIRATRKNANDESKHLEKNGIPEDEIKKLTAEIQKNTDDSIKKIDHIAEIKEADIMKI